MTTATIGTIEGGITAPTGFRSGAVHAGIKARNLDLALIVADAPAAAAGVFTTNQGDCRTGHRVP